ncbi:uncharacterized protein LOC123317366 isoform X5 [Coccinella septempunctata]|uniref:uncharacterized protein LOC123317366 isoform X4 n=1 Tax=Coccinella septempunctata TaxID=41139 RepID=UPI001D087F6E|nr:uncharacterized protein LOC123317366 isoform X4 [Coccinella septempunctata]XP_044759828.1 uncharacterized protein LOC123317366 isoform X5 [Coccinella septempunctata]
MNRASLVICLVSLIVLASARDSIYIPKPTLSGDILRDPRIKDCVERCPIPRIVSIVCGSDGKSYINEGSVRCADKCLKPFGESVQVAYHGYCLEDVRAEKMD